jgi:hypothetical protein
MIVQVEAHQQSFTLTLALRYQVASSYVRQMNRHQIVLHHLSPLLIQIQALCLVC